MRTIFWSPTIGDVPVNLALTNNYDADAAPTATDDATKGYSAGSTWIHDGTVYTLVDATPGAAVWANDAQADDLSQQGDPVAHDTAATMTAADLAVGIITSAPAGAINLQLPLAADMDTEFPEAAADSAFDFSVIDTDGTNAVTVTTNTGWTLVGSMVVAKDASSRFRARKTAAGTWTLYRLS